MANPARRRRPNRVSAAIGIFCDPQLGCSDRLVAAGFVDEHAWQFSQEFRLASNFSGPFNFSVGGNYMHYETEENYYVFINSLTLTASWMTNCVITVPALQYADIARGFPAFRTIRMPATAA